MPSRDQSLFGQKVHAVCGDRDAPDVARGLEREATFRYAVSVSGSPTASSSGSASGSVCVDFETPLVVGTQYGAPAGQTPGSTVFNSAGIAVSVENFNYATSGGTFNLARVEAASASFGTGQVVRTNNINLEFDLSGVGFAVTSLDFDFLDMGGNENLAVNGSPLFSGERTSAPTPTGGANLSFASTAITGGKVGKATLAGPLKSMLVGGQEFWLDNLCAHA
jgi:hypothetical protein